MLQLTTTVTLYSGHNSNLALAAACSISCFILLDEILVTLVACTCLYHQFEFASSGSGLLRLLLDSLLGAGQHHQLATCNLLGSKNVSTSRLLDQKSSSATNCHSLASISDPHLFLASSATVLHSYSHSACCFYFIIVSRLCLWLAFLHYSSAYITPQSSGSPCTASSAHPQQLKSVTFWNCCCSWLIVSYLSNSKEYFEKWGMAVTDRHSQQPVPSWGVHGLQASWITLGLAY